MKVYLGIDLGTSCVKVAFLNEQGEIAALGSCDVALNLPKPGYAQQDPEEWWSAARTAICQAKKKCPQAVVSGIGISGQMLGSVLLDEEKKPLDECIIWLDQRADIENEEIKELLGPDKILDVTANYPLVSYWAPKLLWIRKNQPELYAKIRHVLFPKDYMKYKLTGNLDIDVTDATGTMLFDTGKRIWDYELFDRLGIDRSFVPEKVSESTDVIGYVTKEAAEYLDIPEEIPVVSGGGDQMCGAIGLGIVSEGKVGSTIGTSGCVFSYSSKCVTDREPRALLSYCHSVPGSWCVYGCTLSAGGSFRWLKDTVFTENSFDEMTAMAQQAAPGSEGLIFLPYLNGERTPHPNPDARGVFFGMSIRHGKPEIARSVMEGVTYSLRDTIEILREKGVLVNEVIASGGGAASELWRQIQADIFKARVITTNVKEAPATGAAMLAAVGAGAFADLEEAAKCVVKTVTVTEPDQERMSCYDDYYAVYQTLYPVLESSWKQLAEVVKSR